MIVHYCLNIFIKNLTVILISSLYLTKFIISMFAKKCVIRPNLYGKRAHVRKSKYQFIHDIRLFIWWCMVLFNFQHFKTDGFHSVHGPFSMTLTLTIIKNAGFPTFELDDPGQTNGLMDKASYWVVCAQLKRLLKWFAMDGLMDQLIESGLLIRVARD